jgi:hypothetical protein
MVQKFKREMAIIEMVPKPDKHPSSIRIDISHLQDLLASLFIIILINADCIVPEEKSASRGPPAADPRARRDPAQSLIVNLTFAAKLGTLHSPHSLVRIFHSSKLKTRIPSFDE